MTGEALGYINRCMEKIRIFYQYLYWSEDLTNNFWVGEYIESETMDEDGKLQSVFILTGTSTNSMISLEAEKEKIRSYFGKYGKTDILPNGSGIAVSYASSVPIRTDEEGIYRLQVNLNVTEWRDE